MLEGWDRRFSTGENVFFKSSETIGWLFTDSQSDVSEMDEYYGDIYSLIIDREVEIIHQLRIKTLTYTPQLTAASRVLGELDWYPSPLTDLTKSSFLRSRSSNVCFHKAIHQRRKCHQYCPWKTPITGTRCVYIYRERYLSCGRTRPEC